MRRNWPFATETNGITTRHTFFDKEWLQYYPADVSALVACAEMQMMRGETKDAMKLYEKVLALDADNLQANIFLGNYYYLQAEQK